MYFFPTAHFFSFFFHGGFYIKLGFYRETSCIRNLEEKKIGPSQGHAATIVRIAKKLLDEMEGRMNATPKMTISSSFPFREGGG